MEQADECILRAVLATRRAEEAETAESREFHLNRAALWAALAEARAIDRIDEMYDWLESQSEFSLAGTTQLERLLSANPSVGAA